jgi:hypothetical protein
LCRGELGGVMKGLPGLKVLSRLTLASFTLVTWLPIGAFAQTAVARLQSKFELTFDCERPFYVRNHPIHATFDAVLNTNKGASADLAIAGMFSTSHVHFDARLGGAWQPAPGGTSLLRVVSSNRLRAVWNLPNNELILDITTARTSCSSLLNIKLKPKMQEYTMFDGSTFYYCSGYRLVGWTCQVQ